MQLTDRLAGVQADPPRRFIALDVKRDQIDKALSRMRRSFTTTDGTSCGYRGEGRTRSSSKRRACLSHPDDPSFRDVLADHSIPEGKAQTMADRDYVRVNFSAAGDAMEGQFRHAIGAVDYR